MKYIRITGAWCDITYHPNSKKDTGMKFLKALKRVQKSKIQSEIGKGVKVFIPDVIKRTGLKIEIIN